MQLEPVMVNNQVVGISSRYDSVQVNPNFYGVNNASNLIS